MERTNTLITDDPDEAREYILDAERSGIDGSELQVSSRPPLDSATMSIADGRYMRRTAGRVIKGTGAGALMAVALTAVLSLIGVAQAGFVLVATIGLVIGGALLSLYGGMSASGAAAEADLPGPTVVELTDSAVRNAL